MNKYNPSNEKIKHKYFEFLKEADQKSIKTIDNVRKAINRFEVYTQFRDFKTFNKEQAMAFKDWFSSVKAEKDDKALSKSTLLHVTSDLKEFFIWLSREPGYKSNIDRRDVNYLNISKKDISIAQSSKFKEFPTLEQVRTVVLKMPDKTEIEKRDRALIAFTILTGMRINALISLKLKHIDITRELVKQEPNEVNTKFSKAINTYFFPVGNDMKQIAKDWYRFLTEVKLYGNNDPLFPKTKLTHDKNNSFCAEGLEPVLWQSTTSAREIFKKAFINAGMPYFHPHSFRDTLEVLGESLIVTLQDAKAWSLNFGHEKPLTTFTCYGGDMPAYKQAEILKNIEIKSTEVNKMDQIITLLKEKGSI